MESYNKTAPTALGDQLPMTLNYVFTDEQFTYGEFREKIQIGLNRWIKTKVREDGEHEWSRDPLIDTLHEKIKSDQTFEEMSYDRFLSTDAHYLQQRLWTNMIAELESKPSNNRFFRFWSKGVSRVDAEKIQTDRNPDRLAVGLSQIHQGINNDHASELAQTIRLFDWTVRNIKLLNLLDNPTQEQIEEQRLLREEGDWAPSLGVKGPGYVRYTWQVLLYGHGDALERARVFIELLQELKIDAAIVELTSEADADGNKTSRTLVGVRIGDATYLFEPNLGVPVMVDNSAELATLEKLKADNGILKGLNLTVEESLETSTKYWPDELGIESINVKLYGTPEGLSSRMQLLEKSLTGQWRLKLVNNPSDTKENWEKLDSDKTVELWNVPFMIKPFRRAIDNALAFNDPQIRSKLFWYAIEERYLDEFVPFRRAKHLYLKGKLSSDSTEEDSGATAIYFDFIYQDELIQSLPVNTPLLESLGLRRPNQSQFDFENRVRDVQQQMYLIRADACFYTAMCHLESESPSPSTALNWLARVKDYEVDDGIYPVRWKEAVVYMTARIHESMGRPEQSIDMLKKDETSPQRHGNMLRARYINQLLNQKTNNND